MTALLAAASLAAAAASASAQTFLSDFGSTATPVGHGEAPNDPGNCWNNAGDLGTSDTGVLANAVTVQNVPTSMGFAVVRRFNGVNESGTTVSTIYPGNGTRDSLFGNTELFGALSNVFPSFKQTGLDAHSTYSFTFYASRTGVRGNRTTHYGIEGAAASAVEFNPANNITNLVMATGVHPRASGEIKISLSPAAANNSGSHFTYLDVLKIQVAVEQPAFMAPAISAGKITLEWTGGGVLESAPSVPGPRDAVEGNPGRPAVLDLTPEHRFFRIRK